MSLNNLIDRSNEAMNVQRAIMTDKMLAELTVVELIKRMSPSDRLVFLQQIDQTIEASFMKDKTPVFSERKNKFINSLKEIA